MSHYPGKKRLSMYQEWRESGTQTPVPLAGLILMIVIPVAALVAWGTLYVLLAVLSYPSFWLVLAVLFFIWTVFSKGFATRLERASYITWAVLAIAMVIIFILMHR